MNPEQSTDSAQRPMEVGDGRLYQRCKIACMTCKKRKIKCDGQQPTCKNCSRFRAPCVFRPILAPGNATGPKGRRGPGRPRKDWGLLMAEETHSRPATTNVGVQCSLGSIWTDPATSPSPSTLSMADVRLLLHFTTHTGPSLVDPCESDHSLSGFWSRNVPEMGLSFPSVLHLALSLAARHLAHQSATDSEQKRYNNALADHHLSIGLTEMTRLLPDMDEDNCGALYVSSLLVSYSGLAAGPRGLGDMLICHMESMLFCDESPGPWLRFVRGARLIRERFDINTLFTGLMAPLGPPVETCLRPSYLRHGFDRVEWVDPMRNMYQLVEKYEDDSADVRRRSFNRLADVFEATFGQDEHGKCDVHPRNRYVFIWLYLMEDGIVECVQRKDPVSLLLVAYYTVLLRTLHYWWFTHGWSEHLLTAIWGLLDEEHRAWMLWPFSVVGMNVPPGTHSAIKE